MTPAEKIVKVAHDAGLELTEVATKADIPYSTLRKYILPGSRRMPPTTKGLALAKALGVDVHWLFDEERGMPAVPYFSPPPLRLEPWPPLGITWTELRRWLQKYADAQAVSNVLQWIGELERDENYVSYLTQNERSVMEMLVKTVSADLGKWKSYALQHDLTDKQGKEIVGCLEVGLKQLVQALQRK